jgi:hypothetical protein
MHQTRHGKDKAELQDEVALRACFGSSASCSTPPAWYTAPSNVPSVQMRAASALTSARSEASQRATLTMP